MPSTLVNNQSGGMPFLSGYQWSGNPIRPYSFLQLRAAKANSGNLYIGLSGGVTVLSGTYIGAGGMDGMELGAGDSYAIPAMVFPPHVGTISGYPQLYVMSDAISSGFSRLFWECF